MPGDLTQDIIDIIYDEIPLNNLNCPNCESDVEQGDMVANYLHASSVDKGKWNHLVVLILRRVLKSELGDISEEAR